MQFFRRAVLVAGVLLAWQAAAGAATPSENLLPATTKGFISAPSYQALEENWLKTELGQLLNDPMMGPFLKDLRTQVRKNRRGWLAKLGLTVEDLQTVPGGEVTLAIVEPSAGSGAVAMIADITGHRKEATVVRAKAVAGLAKQGAKASAGNVPGVMVYTLPLEQGEKTQRKAVFYVQGDLMVASDNLAVLEGIVRASTKPRTDSLARVKAFAETNSRCAKATGELKPHLRWFVEPFGYAAASRAMAPPREKKRGKDMLQILRNQGFAAVKGFGGHVNFMAGRYEILHRTAIYAPPTVQGPPEKYELAARMLNFPNAAPRPPQDFVPAEVATYMDFNWKIPQAFDASETLVDEIANDPGLFDDVLESLATAKRGPKVDVRAELVANMLDRVSVIGDYRLPIDPQGERLLFAVAVINPEIVADALARAMAADDHVFKREFEGHVIWETVYEKSTMPPVDVDSGEAGDIAHADEEEEEEDEFDEDEEEEEEDEEEEPPLLPHGAMTVADGYLLVASHIDFLQEALTTAKGGKKLADTIDYQAVTNEMARLGATDTSFRFFSRTDEAYRPTYELIRAGRLPEADSALARVLNNLLSEDTGESEEIVLRKQKIDGSKLPEFTAVARYLGPAGTFVTSQDDGWFIVGFTLNRELPEEEEEEEEVAEEAPASTEAPAGSASTDAAPAAGAPAE